MNNSNSQTVVANNHHNTHHNGVTHHTVSTGKKPLHPKSPTNNNIMNAGHTGTGKMRQNSVSSNIDDPHVIKKHGRITSNSSIKPSSNNINQTTNTSTLAQAYKDRDNHNIINSSHHAKHDRENHHSSSVHNHISPHNMYYNHHNS